MAVLKGLTPEMCASSFLPPGARGSVDAADVCQLDDALGESAAEQWAELGGGW